MQQPTRWSLVRIASGSGDAALQALGEILRHYWYPLYAFARRRGLAEHDAADAVQSFCTRLCAGNLLAQADEERGRLRSWMLKCFQNHLSGLRAYSAAAVRGGGALHIDIDWPGAESIYQSEPGLVESPEALYTRAWAHSLMEEALHQLATYYKATGRSDLYEALLPSLEAPRDDLTYADVAATLQMSAGALRAAGHRLRHRYRAILLELASQRLGITCEAALGRELRAILTGQ